MTSKINMISTVTCEEMLKMSKKDFLDINTQIFKDFIKKENLTVEKYQIIIFRPLDNESRIFSKNYIVDEDDNGFFLTDIRIELVK